jgi:hypothetical protein
LISFLLFVFGLSFLWIVVVMGQMGAPSSMSQWVYDAYKKKDAIASSIEGKKILIVAGSNALFGVDSQLVSGAFGLPVVNYGVNAGIELPSTLFMAQRVIQRHDIVIMPLEYPMYSYTGEAGVQMIDFVLSRESGFLSRLTLKEQFYIFWHVSVARVFEGYFKADNKPVKAGLYGAHHIDGNGDQIETDVSFKTDPMFAEIENHHKNPEMYGAAFDADALGWKYLDAFVQWCDKREIKVIFMPSTLLRNEVYLNDKKEKMFFETIAKRVRSRGWMFVGNPYDYMYDESSYFNTDFHLIDSARKRRTEQMIEDLKSHFDTL